MTDIVSSDIRKRMMSNIRSKNTKPELYLRKGLHKLGFRFRVNYSRLPGKPDIVFPRYHAVIFANGCFWHGHNCHLFRWPSTREQFWREKINRNKELDIENFNKLRSMGWRIGIVWECSLKGKYRLPEGKVIEICAQWLKSDAPYIEISGEIQNRS